jgi:O-antigen/teichoic acid export membrane protein
MMLKLIVQQVYMRHSFEKLRAWGKLIMITGFSQVIIQGIGFISGILVIRLLPTHEYGLYTLANTMLGTMLVLADGGISNSVMAQGGRVWANREGLGVVIASGFNLSKKFAMVSLMFVIPTLVYLLRHNHADGLTSLLITGSLIPAFLSALSGNLLSVALLLNQSVAPFQKVQMRISLLRMIILFMLIFIFPWAFVAVLSSSLPQIWGNLRLKALAYPYIDSNQKPDPFIQSQILTVVKRILPGSIYYCLSSQITIWIISFFGSTAAVAQIGALGRLSMVLVVFSTVFRTLVSPYVARLENNRDMLLKRYLQISLILIILFSGIIVITSVISGPLLWILGKSYTGLESELVLSITGSCISVFAGLLFSVATSRNWAIHPIISVPLSLTTIIGGVFFLNLSTLTGVLKLNILIASVELLLYFVYNLIKINQISWKPNLQR